MRDFPIMNRAKAVVAVALVDDEDFDFVSSYSWHMCGGYAVHSYARPGGNPGCVSMHRIITDPPSGLEVDHANGNRLDNRRENLRICTRAENQRNRTVDYRRLGRFKGVTRDRQGRGAWRARIMVAGSTIDLGYFQDELDAKAAYDRKAKEIHGDFFRS